MSDENWPALSALHTGLHGKCPRCGRGKLFNGFLQLAPKCTACDLDYSFADPADGPAFFVMMIFAIPVTAFVIWVEMAFSPPIWVHLFTSLPFLLATCIPPLRPLKGWLVASQYQNNAREAQLVHAHDDEPQA